METLDFLGGTEEKSVSPTRGHLVFALKAKQLFLHEGNKKDIELVARPLNGTACNLHASCFL